MKIKSTNAQQQKISDLAQQDQIDPLLEWIFQKQSSIHGIGVFAGKQIQKGQKIYWDLPVLGYSEYQEIIKHLTTQEQEYFLMTKTNVYDVRHSILRYLNHSGTPNMDWGDGYLIAIRDLHPEEELTINYGWDRYEWETLVNQ